MFENSIIRKTGQWWKVQLFFWGSICGGLIMFIGLANLDKEIAPILVLPGIVIGIASIVYGCIAIRCPKCKARWVWLGISGKRSNQWLSWLMSQSQCPKCDNLEK